MNVTGMFKHLRQGCIGAAVGGLLSVSMAATAAPLQEITYLLPAPSTLPAFGPWMLAQAKGYYEQEGLKVNFVAARGGVDVAKQLGAGNAVIGGAIGDTPIIARAQGIPVKAVAVLGLAHSRSWSVTKMNASKALGSSKVKQSRCWPTPIPPTTHCWAC